MKNGSKKDFYKWIDDIKKAYRHKAELEEKLKFYESRLVGYNAVTYDHIGSSSKKNNVESNLLYVIDKITYTKNRMKSTVILIRDYEKLKQLLSLKQKKVLYYLTHTNYSKNDIALKMEITNGRIYQILNSIAHTKKSNF